VPNLPIDLSLRSLINDLKNISWQACDILLYYSQRIKDERFKSKLIKTKNNNEPVTLADFEVNSLIIQEIKKKYNKTLGNILSEEGVKDHNLFDNDWLWILDPLDGTKDFIQSTENFAMHLALNFKKKPFLGVVLIPMKEELWITDGNQVWCENKRGVRKETNLSHNKVLNNMTIVTSKNHNNQFLKNLINKIRFKNVVEMGSIGCKISSILKGESDIYISFSMPGKSSPKDWDFAAPEIILRNAGGAITNLYNEELSYNQLDFKQEGMIIASNDINNHKNICLEIQNIINKYDLLPPRTN
tara:strand:+ start:1846 stop:2748 length:903 start_codon:yes stop_codon:yes gene_type:complete